MGDLKESALTQKNDCKWVRALDENGNSIRISKEDLAAVVGGLIGTASIEKDGLLPKNMAGYYSGFSSSDFVIEFGNIYELQSFMVTVYLNGHFSTYLVNPSLNNHLTYFDIRYIGKGDDISFYAKPNDPRVYIKSEATVNGRIAIQFLASRSTFQIRKESTPSDFTKIEAVKM